MVETSDGCGAGGTRGWVQWFVSPPRQRRPRGAWWNGASACISRWEFVWWTSSQGHTPISYPSIEDPCIHLPMEEDVFISHARPMGVCCAFGSRITSMRRWDANKTHPLFDRQEKILPRGTCRKSPSAPQDRNTTSCLQRQAASSRGGRRVLHCFDEWTHVDAFSCVGFLSLRRDGEATSMLRPVVCTGAPTCSLVDG